MEREMPCNLGAQSPIIQTKRRTGGSGAEPTGGVIEDKAGKLSGGAGRGTVFRLPPDGTELQRSFDLGHEPAAAAMPCYDPALADDLAQRIDV